MYENNDPKTLTYVGKSALRKDVGDKLTGKAMYVSDMKLPGMLYAQVKKSPHARARIVHIDTAKAEALPGVRAVLTGDDLSYRIGLYIVDKNILAKGEVRHYGEAVAAVAATSLEIARKAVDLIEVEYEVMQPVLNHMDAMKEDAVLVHPDLGSYEYLESSFTPVPNTNIANWTKLRKGDVEKGFKESAYIVEREYDNPSVQHVPMETHVAIVQWGPRDTVTIWTSAQSPFTVRNLFCHTFSLPLGKVRVIVPAVGGGFGGKAGIHLEPLVACLSRKAGGLPVKFQATREEEFSLLPCRSALTYRIKTGVSLEGKILAQKMEMFWDAGAYADYAVNVTRASGYSASGPYEIPNAWVDAYTVYTNKPYGTAYRGFGHVEFHWGVERHMDLIAKIIGIDPLEFRKKNALRPGSITLTGEKITAHTGNVIACMDAVAKSIKYGKLTAAEKRREAETGKKIGKGIALLQKAPAMPSNTATAAVIKMNSDASVTVNIGLTEIGQGSTTALAQIVAERLGFDLDKVYVKLEKDTESDPYDWQTVASKGLLMSGNACILACEDMLRKGYAVASHILKAGVEDLAHDGERIYVKHDEENSISWQKIAVGYAYPDGESIGGPLIGVGSYIAQGLSNLDKQTGQGKPALDWTFGAHGIICEVDPVTGEYAVRKIASAFDVGKVVNPSLLRGQIVGGMLQGLGTAVCEGYIYDEAGHLLNPSFTDNKIPTSRDLPMEIETIAVESSQIDGPYGARGVAEHPMISVAPALGNAIQSAVDADLLHMPIRAEDVWRAMHNHHPIDNWITKTPTGSCRSDPAARRHTPDAAISP
ncbi:xanthine dehydrogenase family protein molybdopterin-binding subunit [Sphaerochaeta halotolerans]|jgi:CO/xanthine dehydrogenase Mo-binding subunit|uniref:Xanthine dehydrogenase family protein molybdopterin-binding subunit n=1 Tax=Sphaerochaeta halotolerans TaxID=2293840 RepID=A0A372MGX5_9SPIR|nr:xanthine dehydrogenase family protein molybdopterin-binding subunit [Sphaerochaeta halotolerans]RFU94994.1 xanthine dehydrogenase family protein molybdopterin-binding subunit [Sphaerochaeta halotolerans]